MSVESLGVVLHHSAASGTAKVVLEGIANHDGDGGSWPSIPTLAKYARVTERNVQAAIKKLVKMGEIEVHLQAGGNRQTDPRYRTNRYEILVSCPADCDRTSKHRSIHDDCLAPELRGLGIVPECTDEGCRVHHPLGVSPASPLESVRGVADCSQGVSPATPEPSLEPTTPQPPASGGRSSTGYCSKPGPIPHTNCRGCGTTNRDLAEQRRIQAEADRKERERQALEAERAEAKRIRELGRSPSTVADIAAARERIRQASR